MPTGKSDLLQGTLDLLILKIVALGPVHGYGISQRIRQISKEVLQVQQGSLYPALHRLEKRGWLEAEWGQSSNGREAKFYELTEANVAAGMSPEEARRCAMLEFGGQEQVKEEVRDVYRVRILDSAIANLKSALRFIRKSPSFSATVILTLALGIGANSAVFSAIDAI